MRILLNQNDRIAVQFDDQYVYDFPGLLAKYESFHQFPISFGLGLPDCPDSEIKKFLDSLSEMGIEAEFLGHRLGLNNEKFTEFDLAIASKPVLDSLIARTAKLIFGLA